MPSHSENFGIVVAEALACGSLIGISNKVNIYEEIAFANAGLIFNDTKDETIKVIKKWLNLSEDERLIIRKNARLLFNKKFNLLSNANIFVSKLNDYL